MSRLYSVLVAAPSRVAGIVTSAIGTAAALKPKWFAEKVGTQVNVETIQQLGIAVLAASVVYFILLWYLKPSGPIEAAGPSTSTRQETRGDGAHNLSGTFGGPIHFGDNNTAVSGSEPPEPPGEMPIIEAVEYVAEVLGSAEAALREIRQAARDGRLTIWGRHEIPSPEIATNNRKWRGVFDKTCHAYWQEWQIVSDLDTLRSNDRPQTEREDGMVYKQTYCELRVKRRKLQEIWRKKPEPEPPSPRRDLGPQGWMAR